MYSLHVGVFILVILLLSLALGGFPFCLWWDFGGDSSEAELVLGCCESQLADDDEFSPSFETGPAEGDFFFGMTFGELMVMQSGLIASHVPRISSSSS